MNIVSKKVSALVFSAIVTTSVFAMDHENMVVQATEQDTSVAWYRKGSVQAVAAAITLAAVGYACAVRMGKVALPALVAGLVAVKTVQDTTSTDISVNNSDIQVTDNQVQNDEQLVADEAVNTTSNFDVKQIQELFAAELSKVELSQKFMKKKFQEQ
jgi:hypothetical protein